MRKNKTKTNIFEHITTVYILLMLTVFLFFVGNNGYIGIVDAKYKAFCVLCGGYILIMGGVAVESLIVGTITLRSPLSMLRASSWVQRSILVYIVLTWVSALISPYFPETIVGATRYEGALTITIYGLCFLLVSVYGVVRKYMLWVLGAVALLFSALCIVQMAGQNPFELYPEGVGYSDAYIKYSGAFLGTIGNVDLVAAWFCLVIPIMWVAILRLKDKTRFLLFIPLVASLIVLLQMNVLAGLVGVFMGGIVMIPIVAPISERCKKIIWALLVVIAVTSAVVLYAVDIGNGFLHEVHELLHGHVNGSFGSGRIQIWSEVLREIPDNILFGTGPDTMIRAGLQGFSKVIEAMNTVIVAEIDVAHNEYLNVLFHQGVLALVSYVGALALLIRKWIQESSKDAPIAIVGAGVFGYCIQALFGLSMCVTAPFFWLTLGFLENRSHLNQTGGYCR